jgi:hypothetical protein
MIVVRYIYKAIVTNQSRKIALPLSLDFIQVINFEIPVARLMKTDQDGHNFTQFQTALTITQLQAVSK